MYEGDDILIASDPINQLVDTFIDIMTIAIKASPKKKRKTHISNHTGMPVIKKSDIARARDLNRIGFIKGRVGKVQ
ncbi:MAG: hypothetical protein FWC51_01945 [Proteobacteria bacterium]|nr:hypothetical protein [Pseudomonadota bacterium]